MHVVFLTDDSTILQSMWKYFIHGTTFFILLGREEFKNNSLRVCVCVYLSSPTVCNFFIHYFNPSIPLNNQDRLSPYNINTLSSRQVMRIRKISIMGLFVDPVLTSVN